jgi:hypothetical protein
MTQTHDDNDKNADGAKTDGGLPPFDEITPPPPSEQMEWLTDATLSIVVIGASGDLANVRMQMAAIIICLRLV